jgi:hypothetical protein
VLRYRRFDRDGDIRQETERNERAGAVSDQARRARQRADVEAKIKRLVDAIAGGADIQSIRQEAVHLIRPVVESIVLHPKPGKGRFSVELAGDLLAIFGASSENVHIRSPEYGIGGSGVPNGIRP